MGWKTLGLGLLIAIIGATLWACASARPPKLDRENPHASFEKAKDLLHRGKCAEAKELLRLLSLEDAGVSYIDSVVYNLASAYACGGEYELAKVEYDRVVNDYPASALVDEAAFGLAYSQFKLAPGNSALDQTQVESAVRSMKDFIAIYPQSDRRHEADSLLQIMEDRLAKKTFDNGRLYLKLDADSAAMVYFQQLWDEYTDSPYAARALWLLAEQARKRENWPLAIKRYEQLIAVYPTSIEVERSKVMLSRIRKAHPDGS